MSLRFFGTDGIRGEYGSDSLNDTIAYRAGKAAARVARERLGQSAPRITIGRDTRQSGEALKKAFAKGVHREGGRVVDLGIAPTPCVAYAAPASQASLACSLTASHNPASDNGIKFFQGDGVKPAAELELALDEAIGAASVEDLATLPEGDFEDGRPLREAYESAILECFSRDLLKGKRVALDCANGATHELAPKIFRALGASVDVVGDRPDGRNINAAVGSEHPASLKKLYESGEYDFGFAFDGDGDRVILVDENGDRVSGEAVLALLALDAKERSALAGDTLVTTVQSNLGLDAALRERGIRVERTDVGDKHIARLMVKEGYSVGGEESGHLVLGEFAITGDGLFAAVRLAEIATRTGKPVSVLVSAYRPFPQATCSIRVAVKPPLESCESLQACIQKLESSFGNEGRLLIRYSGTEPKLRLLVEAKSESAVAEAMKALREAVRRDMEVVA